MQIQSASAKCKSKCRLIDYASGSEQLVATDFCSKAASSFVIGGRRAPLGSSGSTYKFPSYRVTGRPMLLLLLWHQRSHDEWALMVGQIESYLSPGPTPTLTSQADQFWAHPSRRHWAQQGNKLKHKPPAAKSSFRLVQVGQFRARLLSVLLSALMVLSVLSVVSELAPLLPRCCCCGNLSLIAQRSQSIGRARATIMTLTLGPAAAGVA